MALTDVAIRNARPRDKRYKLFDGGGLYIEVYPQGGRYWRLKYRFGGKEKRLTLGVYPEVTIATARSKAGEARSVIADGADPVTERRVAEARNAAEALDTFETVAREWMTKNIGRWSPTYADKIRGTMETAVFPPIGTLPITKLDAPLVRTVIEPIEARGALEAAKKTRKWISEVFTHAIGTGRIALNPCDHVKVARRTPKNHPHLTRAELGDFLRKLAEYSGRPETRIAVRMLLMTAVRTGELRPAQWKEFDLSAGVWRVPADRMKMRAAHIVPLSRQAVALLKELKQYSGYSEYLFPNHGKHPYMSENTVNKAIAMIGYKGRIVGHGFRATFSTAANESGLFSGDAIERQLAHAPKNNIRAIYNHAEHLPERKKLMQWWSDALDAAQKGAEVVRLRR